MFVHPRGGTVMVTAQCWPLYPPEIMYQGLSASPFHAGAAQFLELGAHPPALHQLKRPFKTVFPRPEAAQLVFQGLGPGFSGYATYGWLQLSWFQQMYARQYYMQ